MAFLIYPSLLMAHKTCLPTAYKVLSLSALTSADTETESLYKA